MTSNNPSDATVSEEVRYPGVFYSENREQRVGVAQYQGNENLTFSWLLENKPGGPWLELQMPADEAEAFARCILNRVAINRKNKP